MDCSLTLGNLIGYHFATASDDERRDVEGHLVACTGCLRSYLALKAHVDGVGEREAPSEGARLRLRAAVELRFRPTAARRPRPVARAARPALPGARRRRGHRALGRDGAVDRPRGAALDRAAHRRACRHGAVGPRERLPLLTTDTDHAADPGASTMRRTVILPLLSLLSCAQAPASGKDSPVPSAPVATAVAAAMPSAAGAEKGMDEDRDFNVPAQKFTDAQRNFEAAKKVLLESYYDPSITEDDLYRAAVAGMLERADGKMHLWNRLMSPTEVGELRNDLQGEIVGIGIKIELDPATGYIDVKSVIPGTPAERAGIAPPDKIVTVDGKLYKGRNWHDVVADIRGKAGDPVTLSILRGDKLVSVRVVREKVAFDQARGSLLTDGVGLVQIPSFNAKTPPAVRDVLTDLASKGARALVIDLRENQGGSFDDAVAVAGELVASGSTVVVVHKRGGTERVVPKTVPVVRDMPMAVLVNHGTASSAELLTAALQELRHATVVGTSTKGKWTVQTIDDLSNGYAIKYTMGVFASPSGRSFEGTGLAPDVEVDQTDEARDHARAEADPVKRLAEDGPLKTAAAIVSHAP